MNEALVKNWFYADTIESLYKIHQEDINIVLFNRNIDALKTDIDDVLTRQVKINAYGTIDNIMKELIDQCELSYSSLLIKDIKNQLISFKQISQSETLRLFLATVETDMCKKFHIDVNDLRMLCTYSGSGTLWLTEDNVNREALKNFADNATIVIDENNIQQAETGTVIILKGSTYPKYQTKAIVHRSPTIENKEEKRLLLRIDTSEFLK
ncbi:DUF1826 domain-containing protein [Tenacibaculum jejuense]|uniref:DUF1826 domain-containing protein n=1 Tax=Tenacibaculum jejuense TaxID=584609 RepID=A0A238U653_9FLAO|nr:DUF1826 domain-containing protein [Tenacibaculum jejuense]SNR14689.1 conserved protein of unknown function [Tenacibaculum jejuense]